VNSKITYRIILDYFVYLLVRGTVQFIYMLPEQAALGVGRFLGRCLYVLLPDRRDAALENLTIAFGKEQSREWIVRTARKSFEHVGMLGIEFFLIRRWDEREMAERIIVEGQLPFNLALLPGNEGILLLTSHFGCFEVSAAATKMAGIKLNLIMTPLKNRFVSRYLFSRGGKDSGVTTFGHKGVVKDLIGLLRAGEMVAVLGDQRGDAERGVFVDYFGTKAPANEIFAKLAIDGNARILPLFTYRLDDGRYRTVWGEGVPIEVTGDAHNDLVRVSQQFHDLFEQWLRLKPEQGFWFQRKWRRKPSRRRLKHLRAKLRKAEAPGTEAQASNSPEERH
jgi:Kdo2-lipid IVA lauroyltransferase/acyltransferase